MGAGLFVVADSEYQKLQWSKCRGILHKMFSCVGLRYMDFLKYFGQVEIGNETAIYSPSGLMSGFPGHPCPEISGMLNGILRKSHIPTQDDCVSILCNMPMEFSRGTF